MAEVWELVGGSIKAKMAPSKREPFLLVCDRKEDFFFLFVKLFTAKVVSGFNVVRAHGRLIKHKI